jgi:hypothetical protein
MRSESNPKQVDPRGTGIGPGHDEYVGLIYKRVVREVLARIDERLAELGRQAADDARAMAFRVNQRARSRRRCRRRAVVVGVTGLLMSMFVLESSDEDAGRALLARFSPQFFSNLLSPKESLVAPDPDFASVRQSETESAPSQAASPPFAAGSPAAGNDVRDNGGRNVPPSLSEMTLLIQTMAHSLERLEQRLEQLTISQDQINQTSLDNTNAIQQLRAAQDQLARMLTQSGPPPLVKTSAAPSLQGAGSRRLQPPSSVSDALPGR